MQQKVYTMEDIVPAYTEFVEGEVYRCAVVPKYRFDDMLRREVEMTDAAINCRVCGMSVYDFYADLMYTQDNGIRVYDYRCLNCPDDR